MIYEVSTWSLPHSLGDEARKKGMEWLKKAVVLNRQIWPAKKFEILTNLDGLVAYEVHVTTTHESLGDAEEFNKQWWGHEKTQPLIAEYRQMADEVGQALLVNPRRHYYQIVESE